MKYIKRHIEKKIIEYLKQFSVIALTGSRQTGKSTLLKHLFMENSQWEYITLDKRNIFERIKKDSDLFVKDISSNIIIDEAQKIPELFHSIKWRVDEGLKYKVILSGSANFHLLKNVTETLAGRVGILELYPLSLAEKLNKTSLLDILIESKNIILLKENLSKIKKNKDQTLFKHMLWGGYPFLEFLKDVTAKTNWFENYRTTYIERDLRDFETVANLSDFQKFYQLLSFQTGNILNLSNIASDIGITVPTCKKYLHLLEASYQFFLLKPYSFNIRKRLIKSPKIYITDTGLCNYFLDIFSIKQLQNSGKLGAIFETSIIMELIKQNSLRTKKVNMYFWQTSNGSEVDLILEKGDNVLPIEIKYSVSIKKNEIKGLINFIDLNVNADYGIVLYRGDEIIRIDENIIAVPIKYI